VSSPSWNETACASGRFRPPLASSDTTAFPAVQVHHEHVDYGANLLGAMVGGVAEYLPLLMGFQFLLRLVAAFYVAVLATRRAAAA